MNTFNAWEIDAEAKRLLNAVGIPEKMLGMPVSKVCAGVGYVRKCARKCGKCESVEVWSKRRGLGIMHQQ